VAALATLLQDDGKKSKLGKQIFSGLWIKETGGQMCSTTNLPFPSSLLSPFIGEDVNLSPLTDLFNNSLCSLPANLLQNYLSTKLLTLS
jgi:hypothetical protein